MGWAYSTLDEGNVCLSG